MKIFDISAKASAYFFLFSKIVERLSTIIFSFFSDRSNNYKYLSKLSSSLLYSKITYYWLLPPNGIYDDKYDIPFLTDDVIFNNTP